MKNRLWAPLEEALNLIMSGSWSGPACLTSTQKKIAHHVTSLASNPTPEFAHLRNRNAHASVNFAQSNLEWYIPDIVRYLVAHCIEIQNIESHLDLDYLNALTDEDGCHPFTFSKSMRMQDWNESETGVEYWALLSKQEELLNNLQELERKKYLDDPVQLEAFLRLRMDFNNELAEVRRLIAHIDMEESITSIKVEPEPLEWIAIAREKGISLLKEYPLFSNAQIAEKVLQYLKDKRIAGRGGAYPSAETIRRRALIRIKTQHR